MKKIDKLIQDAQSQVQQAGQQLQQMVQQREQLNQMIEQGTQQYNAIVARLNTLQEVAGTGDELFRDEEVPAIAEAAKQAAAPSVSEKPEVGTANASQETKGAVIQDVHTEAGQ